MYTLSETVKQVRKDQITTQQNITLNLNLSQSPHPTELLKIKKEFAEEPKALHPHQSPTRKEVSSPSSQQTPSPRKEYSTPSHQRAISTPSSSRKKSHHFLDSCRKKALKKKGFSVYEEKKKEEEPLEIIPIISWELIGKIGQFIITYKNGVQEYLSADRIVTLGDEEKEKKEQYFGNEDDPDISDGESPTDIEVPLAQSQTLISKWYYDQELKKFFIKRLYFTFSKMVDLSVLSPAELKFLSLMPMSSTTEEGKKLLEKIR
ncbi:hypothetical protein L1987_60300 [Smallanthus sonchifolius]|uniref:Uncharacterized protein n=1 Tax=Smallanthus sonchifolius TaxID=185202 RepID=A0ACB9D807_9ASTR|nr:hypothetical protein L1987_60300 [Smallanthus sonchifolius]